MGCRVARRLASDRCVPPAPPRRGSQHTQWKHPAAAAVSATPRKVLNEARHRGVEEKGREYDRDADEEPTPERLRASRIAFGACAKSRGYSTEFLARSRRRTMM